MTHRDMEALAGEKIDSKVVLVHLSEGLYHRQSDGSWERYPDYPETPVSKNV